MDYKKQEQPEVDLVAELKHHLAMTNEEKQLIKEFITYYENKHFYLKKNDDIFNGDDKNVAKKVLDFIMSNQALILDYFSFNNFLKPLIRKLGRKLFDYGMITADECLYYVNISLR